MTENVSEAKSRLRTQVLTERSQELAADTASEIGSQLLVLCSKLGARSVGIYLSFGSEPVTDVFVIGAKPSSGATQFVVNIGTGTPNNAGTMRIIPWLSNSCPGNSLSF
jgi:hypothetical protein